MECETEPDTEVQEPVGRRFPLWPAFLLTVVAVLALLAWYDIAGPGTGYHLLTEVRAIAAPGKDRGEAEAELKSMGYEVSRPLPDCFYVTPSDTKHATRLPWLLRAYVKWGGKRPLSELFTSNTGIYRVCLSGDKVRSVDVPPIIGRD